MQLDHSAPEAARRVTRIPLDSIAPRPEPPHPQEDASAIRELAASIRRDGLIQPLTVRRRADGRYAVISGNRRLLACRLCGMTSVDAVVTTGTAAEDAMQPLIDQLLAGDMDYLDEAEALYRLCTAGGMTHEALARRLGWCEEALEDKLALLELSEPLRALLHNHHLPSRTAYALLRMDNEEQRMAIARQAARQQLSVADVDLLVSSTLRRQPNENTGRTLSVMRDERLYLNAIRALVTQMQNAGLTAEISEHSQGARMQLTICVPTPRKRRADRYRRQSFSSQASQ